MGPVTFDVCKQLYHKCFLKIPGTTSLERELQNCAAEQELVYNFGSRRPRYPNLVSIPPKIDISDTLSISSLLFEVILSDNATWRFIQDGRRLQKHDCP